MLHGCDTGEAPAHKLGFRLPSAALHNSQAPDTSTAVAVVLLLKCACSCSAMAQRMSLVLLGIALLVAALTAVRAADPDPLQDFCVADLSKPGDVNGYPCKAGVDITDDDFFFDGLTKEKIVSPLTSPHKSTITFALSKHWPALNTQGLSLVRLDLAPGGVVVPHTHALATEIIYVLHGKIYTGFVTNDNKLYAKTLSAGETYIFPRALLHFQLNAGDGPAASVNFLNSQNPGIQFSTSALFKSGIDPAVLATSFGITNDDVSSLTDKIITPKGP